MVFSILDNGKFDDGQPIEAIDRDPYVANAGLSELIVLLTHQFSTKSRILVNFLGMLGTIRWGGKGLLIGTMTSGICQAVEEKRKVRLEREKEAAEEKEERGKVSKEQKEEV